MTDKERLGEIKDNVLVDKVYYKYLDGTKGHWGKTYTLSEKDYKYLIQQAERVREYEYTQKYEDELIKQNKHYRESMKKLKQMVNDSEVDCGMICDEIREMELKE